MTFLVRWADLLNPHHYFFNPHAVPLFVASGLLVLLSIRILLDRGSRINFLFVGFVYSCVIWLFFVGCGYLVRTDHSIALFWFRLDEMGIAFTPAFVYAITVTFLQLERRKSVYLAFGLAGFFSILLLTTNLIIYDVKHFSWGFFPQWNRVTSWPFIIFFCSFMSTSLNQYIYAYRKIEEPIRKNQIKYMFLGFAISNLGAVNYLTCFGVAIYPIGFFSMSCFVGIMAYAIQKHRLMDIGLLTRDTLGRGGTFALLMAPFWIMSFFWHGTWATPTLTAAAMGCCLGFYRRLYPRFQSGVDAYIFRNRYSYLVGFQKMAMESHHILSLREFLPSLAAEVVATAQVRSCTIIILLEELASRPRFQTTAVKKEGKIIEGLEWPEENALFLMHILSKQPGVIFRDELMEAGNWPSYLKPDIFEAAVSLKTMGRIFGLIAVGPKTGKARIMNVEDANALQALADAIADGLWARLEHYEQTMRIETGLHDAINYFDMTHMGLLTKGMESKWEPALAQGQELLKDLRYFNQMAINRQLGVKKEPKVLDVVDTLQQVLSVQKMAAKTKDLTVNLKAEETLPQVLADPGLLNRGLSNLIGNAIKYTPNGGQIDVSVKISEPPALNGSAGPRNGDLEVVICVSDNGPGIPKESLDHIFDPFYRVPGRESLVEGTGLGLAIVKEYITSIGGRVGVHSDEGKGAQFFCWIPVVHKPIVLKK